jgi:hypothetical protein
MGAGPRPFQQFVTAGSLAGSPVCHQRVLVNQHSKRCSGNAEEQREMVRQREFVSFVARIWLERGTNGEPLWRGHIRHIQGDKEAYFQGLRELNEFLEQVSGVSGPGTKCPAKEPVEDPKARVPTGRKRRN